MPNHVYQRVEVQGDQTRINEFFTNHFTENSLDFNTFIPMPDELRETTSPVRNPESERNKRLRETYGADNWYDWSCHNWGTKWNSYDNNRVGNSFEYQTAWSLPAPILRKIAEGYPDLTFTMRVIEEGGFFAGYIVIQNGDISEKLDENWEQFAKNEFGWNFDEE